MLLGRKAYDFDIATNATPEQVKSLFPRIIPTGIAHGTVTIPFQGLMIECTTFRTETGFSDGRRPDAVHYAGTIEEDLSRRDFTMNSIAVSLKDGALIDPFGGQLDIRQKIIRSVGNAVERFSEDGLRPVRAVRFASQLHFTIEEHTLKAIPLSLSVTSKVAYERIRDEFSKIVLSSVPSNGLYFMEETGLLTLLFPELADCRGVTQKGSHVYDVLDHLFHACDASVPSLEIRLAALLHDIGKPESMTTNASGEILFYNHEVYSERIAEQILNRLRYPLKTIKTVCHLIKNHMFHYESNWTNAAVRRFIARTGVDFIEALFELRKADSAAIYGNKPHQPLLEEFQDRIDQILKERTAFSLKDIAVNGSDIAALGVRPGPVTGVLLNELLEAVLEDPSLNTRDRLLEIVRRLCDERQIPRDL